MPVGVTKLTLRYSGERRFPQQERLEALSDMGLALDVAEA